MSQEHKSSNGLSRHDDVYAAVFSLVGQQRNETIDDLARVLPTIKNADPAELKELEARRALRDLLHPPKDPLRVEYEKAAAEDGIDDLSTEEGEWIDTGKKEDDEEVDENGIPVVKLSRASSNFILDGPGDVKVDNFTPEGEPDGGADGNGGSGAPCTGAPTTGPNAATVAAPTIAPAPYVPSAIARAQQAASAASPTSTASAAAVVRAAAGTAASAGPVVTLEDEIRARRAAAAEPVGAGAPTPVTAATAATEATGSGAAAVGAAAGAASDSNGQEPQQRRGSGGGYGRGGDGDDEDAPEVVPEPAGPHALLVPPRAEGADGLAADGAAAAADAAAGATYGADAGGPSCLPGECQDTSREDALWQSLQGVDGRALLEHMGLAGPMAADDDEEEETGAVGGADSGQGPLTPAAAGQEHEARAEAGTQAGTDAQAKQFLPNGQRHGATVSAADGGGAEGSSREAGDDGGDGASAADGAAAVAAGPSAAAPRPEPSEDGHIAAAGSGAAASADGGAGATAGGEAERRLVPHATARAAVVTSGDGGGTAGRGGSRPESAADPDGPTFEAVEAFSLDPDFDYDNVKLTPREFPYSLLSARWAPPGAGVAR